MQDELTALEALILAVYCAAQEWNDEAVMAWLCKDFEAWNRPRFDVQPFAPLAWMIRVAKNVDRSDGEILGELAAKRRTDRSYR